MAVFNSRVQLISSHFNVRRLLGALLLAVPALTISWVSIAHAQPHDWPRWMGPQGDGVWRETGIIKSFPENGLEPVWRIPIHGGYSGPAVFDGRVFVTDWIKREKTEEEKELRGIPGTERVLCLDAATGELLWSHNHETFYRVSYDGGPRSTPWVEEDRVYSLGTMGNLICLNVENGEIYWQKDLAEAYDTKPPVWGFASHPLVVDDLLICTVGGPGSGVVAMDKMTGEERWTAVTAEEIGYAPPVLMETHDQRQLIVWYDVAICGLDVTTGKELWTHAFPKTSPQRPSVSIVTPRLIGNRVFVGNFYHGSILLEIGENHRVSEIWSTEEDKQHADDLNTIMSTPVVIDGHLIGVAGNGEVRCIDIASKQVKWRDETLLGVEGKEDRERGFAALVFVQHEDRYFVFTDQGELAIVNMSPESFEIVDSMKLLDTTGETRGRAYVWCHPAFANGHLYVRNEKEMICVDLREATHN